MEGHLAPDIGYLVGFIDYLASRMDYLAGCRERSGRFDEHDVVRVLAQDDEAQDAGLRREPVKLGLRAAEVKGPLQGLAVGWGLR